MSEFRIEQQSDEDPGSNKQVACEVLRELALTDSMDDEVRLAAASTLLHADDDFNPPLDLDEIATAVAEKIAAK